MSADQKITKNEGEVPAQPEKPTPPAPAEEKKTRRKKAAAPRKKPALPAEQVDKKDDFLIVGIGASAGGLDAIEKFFSGLSDHKTPGMAFVLVQHLDPTHKSILADLVGRFTTLKVQVAADGMQVAPNCVYIIPHNKEMAILNGALYLMDLTTQRGRRLPIDTFFRALAEDRGERAAGIVLSGTGTDGTLGLKDMKGKGSLVIVQDPDTAGYDGMPRSAISAGLADLILPPEEMAGHLLRYAGRSLGDPRPRMSQKTDKNSESNTDFHKIYILLRSQSRHDFSAYKETTIRRRVEKRMSINQIDRLETYIRYLQENPTEVMTLFRELLIGVTQFFRDPQAFAVLEETIIPAIFKGKVPGEGVRVWTAGCSTGEEAYSIAMLLHEHASQLGGDHPIQVFATDIDSESIDFARFGVYPAGISADVPPERLKRHFDKKGETYTIKKTIREMVIFADQNMISDPPFSKLDLLTCRNLLIYLKPELQKKLFPLFHYALRPGGYLMLGTSETIGRAFDDFTVVNRQQKIYQRTGDQQHSEGMPVYVEKPPTGRLTSQSETRASDQAQPLSLKEWAEAQLLNAHTPACAVVDAQGEIHYIHGRTGQYLEPASGEASLNIFKMARQGLKIELVNAVRQAARTSIPVRRSGLKVKTNGDFISADLLVESASDHPGSEKLYLVILEKRPVDAPPPVLEGGRLVAEDQKEEHIARLEHDLKAKEEYLQSVIEELETANEELKSTNEELQSSNEELQSTNEELETSREELQSVNEELSTVNNELVGKIDDLTLVNNDMSNLLASTEIGTLFLDHDQNILRFTPAAVRLVPLLPSDIGRPVSHFATNLNYDHLQTDIQSVLDTLRPVEVELQTRDGSWYLMRIMPYRTTENVIEGAVLTFVAITTFKSMQAALQDTQALARVVQDSKNALTVQDFSGRIMAWNPAAEELYGWSQDEALGMNIDVLVPEDGREAMRQMLAKLADGKIVEPFAARRLTKAGRTLAVRLTAVSLMDENGAPYGAATIEQTISSSPSGE